MKKNRLKYLSLLGLFLIMSCDIQKDMKNFFLFITTYKDPDEQSKICLRKIEEREYLDAYKFCEKACKKGVKIACMKQAYILDAHIKDGVHKAIAIYFRLCANEEAEACYNLGNIYAKGRTKDADSDKKAKEFFSKACKMGLREACLQVYQSVGTQQEETERTAEEEKVRETEEENIRKTEEENIREMVVTYHNAVAEERIEDALDFYVSYRKPHIKVNLLEAIGRDTEYYIVEEVDVVETSGNTAKVYVRVRQKVTYSPKEQVWEGIWTVEKENGGWKIVRTPGRRIQ